jgi:hypothetical protein
MKHVLLALVLIPWMGAATPVHAEGMFGGGSKLDPSFCKPHNIRQTVIYIDDTVLVAGDTSWAVTIYNKLKATLVPGELTTLVELSPASGQSTEIWSGCWPAYTAVQTAKLAGESHIFSTSPLAALKDQQSFFARDFGVAAEKIEQKGGRPAAAVAIDPSSPPQKSILRALASDGARYAHSDSTIRAIIYSDLAENSDLGSVFKPPLNPPMDYGTKLGAYLRRSVFYAFGVGTNVKGDGSAQDTIRAFWTDALRTMQIDIGGFGTDLHVPNIVPVSSHAYNLALNENGQTLVGRLSLLIDSDGTLVDSWIGITLLRNATINGVFHCTGSADLSACTLTATTSGGVVSTSPTETIALADHGNATLSGTIGVQGSHVNLPITATPTID